MASKSGSQAILTADHSVDRLPPVGDDDNAYFYNASIPAAAIFAALYGLVMAVHITLAIRYRMIFLIVLLIGCLFEFEGYVIRSVPVLVGLTAH